MDKKQILLDHLAIAKTSIYLDTKVDGVKLPSHLMKNEYVSLNLSNKFGLPMKFTADKVVATLTFKGMPYECHIPYKAILMIKLADGNLEDAIIFDKLQNNDLADFMADLESQFDRDDVILGSIENTNKPQ